MRRLLRSALLTLVLILAANCGATSTPDNTYDLSKTYQSLGSASLAVGPVPARPGDSLKLILPGRAQRVTLQLFSLDMRPKGEVTVAMQDRASLLLTSDLAAGVYLVKVTLVEGCTQRNALQKVVIQR